MTQIALNFFFRLKYLNQNEIKILDDDENSRKTNDENEELTKLNCCQEDFDDLLKDSSDSLNLIKAFSLGVGYAAIIGGSGSLIGGTTNILLKGYFDEKYPNDGLNFLTFMLFSLPISIIILVFTWIMLCFLWFPKKYKLFLLKKAFFLLFNLIFFHY